MTAPKQGRVQIIVDGRTWFDQVCTDRHLEVDSDAHVTFTADWPSNPNHNRVPGPTGTVLDGVIKTRYAFACHDCGETGEFADRAEFDKVAASHECRPPIYTPSETDLMKARAAIMDITNGIDMGNLCAWETPAGRRGVIDEIIKRAVVVMGWKPGDAPSRPYKPSATDLIRARNVVVGPLAQVAQHKRPPSIALMDELIKGVVAAMGWKPGDAE